MAPCPAPTSDWQQALLQGARELGLPMPEASLAAYHTYLELLLAEDPAAGLTSITDPTEIAVKHFLDSLACLLVREIRASDRVADVGSGAGFPGIVLAIACPASYALIEANRKRAAFLEQAAKALGLRNIAVLPFRAEEIGQHPGHRESYDLVLSRAVAPLSVLLEYCLPLARLGGHFFAYKGPAADQELAQSGNALQALGGRVTQVRRIALPRDMGRRVIIEVEKVAPTPPRYPRRPGVPAKRPL